ncbi:hypothetical protein [Modestobacter sp. NPDC049651]|uniref:hypothetical protein n=1 Tax=unclassified Modestobacter TaxID=2643866 RepID=UPI0034076358
MAQQLWDGTFSTEAVATAGLARLDQLHAEAMATIAAIAAHWDAPADAVQPAGEPEDTTFSDPESWYAADDDELDDEDAHVLPVSELPPLPPLLLRPRRVAAASAPVETADDRLLAAS